MANRFLEPFSYFTPYLHFDATGVAHHQAASTVPHQAVQAAAAVQGHTQAAAVHQAAQAAAHVQHQQHNQQTNNLPISYQNPYYNHFMTQNLNR